jgi:glycosyltransferase involved in cell wall biosynthesis
MKRVRLAILASHPIPYQAPLYRRLAERPEIELLVVFGDAYGKTPRPSSWGVKNFTWAGGVTEGYPHVFVPNLAPRPDPSAFAGKLNPGLFAELRRFRPDAVLLIGYASVYHLQGAVSSGLLGARLLFFSDASRPPKSDLRGLAKRAFLSLFYPRVDAFLAIGENNRRQYLASGVPEAKIFHFPYAVDNAHFRAVAERVRPQRDALRRRFGVPEGATCVAFVGRLSPEKNVEELIRGVAAAPGQFLLVVGAGPEQASLSRLARELLPERHCFAGFLNYDQLGDGYGAADIFGLTSHHEPWGLVCNEAMNFGLPIVVSSNVDSAADLVLPGETGLVYPSGDIEALRRALMDVEAMLRADRARVARATTARVELYSIDAMVNGLLQALEVKR